MKYRCPLCKKEYDRLKWFQKHIKKYNKEKQRKIFFDGEKILEQVALNKFLVDE